MAQKYKVFFNLNTLILAKNTDQQWTPDAVYENPDFIKIKEIIGILLNGSTSLFYVIIADNLESTWNTFKSFFEIRKAAGGLVINEKNERLFIKRNGIWDLPKGHLEKNEKNRVAALREVEEECGIKNLNIERKLLKTYHTYLIKKRIVLKPVKWYLMSHKGVEVLKPQEKEGITEVKWANHEVEEELIKNIYPSIIEVLKKASNGASFSEPVAS